MGRRKMSDEEKKWSKLPEEWREAQMAPSKTKEELLKEVSTTAINAVVLELAKEADEDLAQLKAQVANAGAVYSEGKKISKLKIEFILQTLQGRGENVPSISDFLRQAREEVVSK